MLAKKCIMLVYNDETQNKLAEFAESLGLDPYINFYGERGDTPQEYHITVMYSSNAVQMPEEGMFNIDPIEVEHDGWCVLGFDQKYLCLDIDSDEVEHVFNFYKSKGLKHSYDKLKIHTTLSYQDITFDEEIVDDLKMIRVPFQLIIDKVRVCNITEDTLSINKIRMSPAKSFQYWWHAKQKTELF